MTPHLYSSFHAHPFRFGRYNQKTTPRPPTVNAIYRVPTPPGKSWIFFVKFRGPGKSWKMDLVLESPGNISVRSWKVMEFLLGYDAGGRHNGVGVGADADICTCTHLVCYFSVTVINVCLNMDAVIIRCIYM